MNKIINLNIYEIAFTYSPLYIIFEESIVKFKVAVHYLFLVPPLFSFYRIYRLRDIGFLSNKSSYPLRAVCLNPANSFSFDLAFIS